MYLNEQPAGRERFVTIYPQHHLVPGDNTASVAKLREMFPFLDDNRWSRPLTGELEPGTPRLEFYPMIQLAETMGRDPRVSSREEFTCPKARGVLSTRARENIIGTSQDAGAGIRNSWPWVNYVRLADVDRLDDESQVVFTEYWFNDQWAGDEAELADQYVETVDPSLIPDDTDQLPSPGVNFARRVELEPTISQVVLAIDAIDWRPRHVTAKSRATFDQSPDSRSPTAGQNVLFGDGSTRFVSQIELITGRDRFGSNAYWMNWGHRYPNPHRDR